MFARQGLERVWGRGSRRSSRCNLRGEESRVDRWRSETKFNLWCSDMGGCGWCAGFQFALTTWRPWSSPTLKSPAGAKNPIFLILLRLYPLGWVVCWVWCRSLIGKLQVSLRNHHLRPDWLTSWRRQQASQLVALFQVDLKLLEVALYFISQFQTSTTFLDCTCNNISSITTAAAAAAWTETSTLGRPTATSPCLPAEWNQSWSTPRCS